jgi:hypothetical protein
MPELTTRFIQNLAQYDVIFPGTTMLCFEFKWLKTAGWDLADKRN